MNSILPPPLACRSSRPRAGCRRAPLAVLAVLAGLALSCTVARADGPFDQRRAREAVLAGEIQPLAQILQRVQPQLDGEVIAIELERERGRWVYEFKVLQPGGRIVEWYVDARDGSVIKTEAKKDLP